MEITPSVFGYLDKTKRVVFSLRLLLVVRFNLMMDKGNTIKTSFFKSRYCIGTLTRHL